jgi:diaminohydroxyphosphoribosylaminopyrimidine deaminase/5-amino-6-(5-phosphoribosylamino)uracil reductase
MEIDSSADQAYMRRALWLAAKGQGWVEPNPMVGCVLVRQGKIVGEGFHTRFGAPHAEIEALTRAGAAAQGATMYVSLEPCCHQGKTPPCVEAIVAQGVARVVTAQRDPFPAVSGRGIARLQAAGIRVDVGVLEPEAHALNAPYRKRIVTGRPWVIAKWAMSLDGKLATHSGQSRWISGPLSRRRVHALRRRVDAVMITARTALRDDPQLTPRPAGHRKVLRVVVDWRAELPTGSQLARSAGQSPVLVAVDSSADPQRQSALEQMGCEILPVAGDSPDERLLGLLTQLGRRQLTNVLVEGGGRLLGSLYDLREMDEVHVFIAPKLIGGGQAVVPLTGQGANAMDQVMALNNPQVELLPPDVYVRGRLAR